MKIYSETAWNIASRFSGVLASETRDLAAHIDAALDAERKRIASRSQTSAIGQSDVEMLTHLADSMGFGRTHDMLRRVIAACPYLRTPQEPRDAE